jgi:hypothetical protein
VPSAITPLSKPFDDHVVAGDVELHTLEIVPDALERTHETLGEFHVFDLAVANTELGKIRLYVVGHDAENRGITAIDLTKVVGCDLDAGL